MTDYTTNLIDCALTLGATLVGVADLSQLESLETHPQDLLNDFKFAISIAISLPTNVFNLISNENPGELYAHYYITGNTFLDQLTFRLSERIILYGYKALAIPASLSLGEHELLSNISHKAIARNAGLGWIGKNLLLINPKHGPRIRLATVLSDIPLTPGKPLRNQNCGNCTKCIDSCPIKALKPFDFKEYPLEREKAFDAKRCQTRLKKNRKLTNIDVSICGICIKVCPVGK
ncbi:MAG: 4Fe-4S double cluster binding domain-containing protein [Promethearchaeota archaeon]